MRCRAEETKEKNIGKIARLGRASNVESRQKQLEAKGDIYNIILYLSALKRLNGCQERIKSNLVRGLISFLWRHSMNSFGSNNKVALLRG